MVVYQGQGDYIKLLILAKTSWIKKKIFLKDAVCEFALLGSMRAPSSLGEVPPWPSREQGKVFICSFKALLSAFVFAEVSVHVNSDVLGETAKDTNHKRIFSV